MATEEEVNNAQKLVELEQQAENSAAKKIELAKELEKLTSKQVEQLLSQQGLTDGLRTRLEQVRDTAKKTAEFLKNQVGELKTQKEALDALISSEGKRYKNAVLTEERNKVAAEYRKAEIRHLKEIVRQGGLAADDAGRRAKELEDLDKKLATFGSAASDMAQGLFSGDSSGMMSAIQGISNSLKGDLTDSIKETVNGADSLGAGLKAAGKQMGALALFTLVEQTLTLAVALGDAENAFMKATGASEDFARSITDTYEEGRKFTATIEDMAGSATSLFNNFTDFTYQDKQTRDSLIETGAVLDKLGISNENFAQAIQISTKGLGMSAEQAGQSMLDLEKYAEELGVSPEKLSSQFLEAGDAM